MRGIHANHLTARKNTGQIPSMGTFCHRQGMPRRFSDGIAIREEARTRRRLGGCRECSDEFPGVVEGRLDGVDLDPGELAGAEAKQSGFDGRELTLEFGHLRDTPPSGEATAK